MKSKVFKITILSKEENFRSKKYGRSDIEYTISEWSLNKDYQVEFINPRTVKSLSGDNNSSVWEVNDTVTFNFQYEDDDISPILFERLDETALEWLTRKKNITKNWDKGKIENTQFYTKLISETEKRYVSYKELLEELHKNKNLYNLEDFEWYKTHLKEMKNFEEKLLKSLVKEWTEIKMNNGY
jgi:hypothetical protein